MIKLSTVFESGLARAGEQRDSTAAVDHFAGVSTDTRQIAPGQLFFCLKGPNFNAHEFVARALELGAGAVVVERQEFHRRRDLQQMAERLFLCDDSLVALQELAVAHRRLQSYTVIGVTGSNGKTSAKEILQTMLQGLLGEEAVDATRGNLNNHIGVPLTLLNLRPGISHAILEMGMNHAGEIDVLARMARPHHGLITSIGRAHIEFFYSQRGIARAKQELVAHCTESLSYPIAAMGKSVIRNRLMGPTALILFGEQDHAAWHRFTDAGFVQVRDIQADATGISLEVQARISRPGEEPEQTNRFSAKNNHYCSRIQAVNLTGCAAVLLAAGFSADDVARAVAHARPLSSGRFQIHEGKGRVLVDDSYNANPDSFHAALQSLRGMLPSGRLLCMAGTMAELGQNAESAHREIGESLKKLDYDVQSCGQGTIPMLESAGSAATGGIFFPDSRALADYIEGQPGSYDVYDGILIKGSRSARMEQAVEALLKIGYV